MRRPTALASPLLALTLLVPTLLTAQEAGSDETVPQTPDPRRESLLVNQPEEVPRPETDAEGQATTDALANPCRSLDQPPSQWLDRVQLEVYELVCGTAYWFDSFFGAPGNHMTSDQTYGRLSLNFRYDSIRGFDPKLRMRAEINLPRFENRVQAIVGREDEEELLRDEATEFREVTPSLRETDDEWLVGLGYSPFRGSKRRLDFTGGLNVRFPLDPFVAARYRRHFVAGDATLIRARQTLFWRNEKGTGLSSRLDVDHVFGENHLMRWSSGATYAEETEGIDWYTAVTFYQNRVGDQAVAYQASWLGETDAPVTIEEFGVQSIYRRRLNRDWLYLQVSPGVVWRRENRDEKRQAVPVVGIGFEMQFGEWPRN